jgi:hypothetical protein
MRLRNMMARFPTTRLLAAAVFVLALPTPLEAQRGGGGSDEAEFLRTVAEHFDTPGSEVRVLSRWGLSPTEIPVVLRLAKRAGVSPDVLVAQRRRGDDWMPIAKGYSLHAGDFHVPIDGPAGFLGAAYERFGARAASRWRDITLSDDEVVGLVNVRFLSRALEVRPARVIEAMGGGGDIVGGFARLKSGAMDP